MARRKGSRVPRGLRTTITLREVLAFHLTRYRTHRFARSAAYRQRREEIVREMENNHG